MIWSVGVYQPNNAIKPMAFHGVNHGNFDLTLNSNGTPSVPTKSETKPFRIHGWLMWLSWSILSLV
jgi:hypothetical protein